MYVKWLNYDFDVIGYYFEYGSVTSRIFRKYYVRPTNGPTNQATNSRSGGVIGILHFQRKCVFVCFFRVGMFVVFLRASICECVCYYTYNIFFSLKRVFKIC